jgi:signal peptidase II
MRIYSKLTSLFAPQRAIGMKPFIWIAVITMILDQITKLMMVAYFHPDIAWLNGGPVVVAARDPIVLIPNCLQFWFRINTGAAFSSLTGKTNFLTLISIVISIGVALWACFLKPGEQGLRLSLGLILGGAVGNLIDRLWHGYVIDFIDAHWRDVYHYPTFNVADSAICVGIFLLFVASFTATQPAEPKAPPRVAGKRSEVS